MPWNMSSLIRGVSTTWVYYSKMLAEHWQEKVKALSSGSGVDRGGGGYPKYKNHVVKKKALIRTLKMPTKNPALTEEFVKASSERVPVPVQGDSRGKYP
jgi:hypothetical protein